MFQRRWWYVVLLAALALVGGGLGLLERLPAQAASVGSSGGRTGAAPFDCQPAGPWQLGPARDPARQYIQAVVADDGKYYTAGGWLPPGGPPVSNDAARFNPVQNAWEALPPMPVPEGVYGMGTAGGKIYVVGGSDIPTRTLTTTVQIFDIAANAWSFGPSVPLPTGVQGPAVAAVGSKLYVLGGSSNTSSYTTTLILDLTTGQWSSGAPVPAALFLSGTTVAGGKIYIFGGGVNGNNATDTLYSYTPATDTWATLAPAPTGGFGQVGNISPYGAGQLLATVGTNSDFSQRTNITFIYDITTNTWAGGPQLNMARYGHAQATLPDGRIMVYGGSTATLNRPTAGLPAGSAAPAAPDRPQVRSNTSELLPAPPATICTPSPTATSTPTPTATATPLCPMQPPWVAGLAHEPDRYYIQGAVGDDGKFYVAGGQHVDSSVLAAADRYNPILNTWEDLPQLPIAASELAIAAGSGQVYAAGGFLGDAVTNTLQVYDRAANRWSLGPPLPGIVEGAGAAVVNGKLYVLGGDDFNSVLTTTLIFNIASNTWSTGAPLPAPRTNTYATAAAGKIYLFGGLDENFGSSDSLLAYDPATNNWTTLAAAGLTNAGNLGAISPYGPDLLLATDGGTAGSVPSLGTHLYQISTNRWQEGPVLNVPRMGHAQGTLPDGRVILYGGLVAAQTTSDTSQLVGPRQPCATLTPTATITATPTRTMPPSATPTALPFTDVGPADYFYAPVRHLASRGIISGYLLPDGSYAFRPYNNATRAQVVKIIGLAFAVPAFQPASPTFRDVPTAAPFYTVIEAAVHAGLISGYNCGAGCLEFHPNEPITRGQLAKVLTLGARWALIHPATPTFGDVPAAAPFYTYIETAVCHGAISGYDCGAGCREFRPGAEATRGQIAKMVYNGLTTAQTCSLAR